MKGPSWSSAWVDWVVSGFAERRALRGLTVVVAGALAGQAALVLLAETSVAFYRGVPQRWDLRQPW